MEEHKTPPQNQIDQSESTTTTTDKKPFEESVAPESKEVKAPSPMFGGKDAQFQKYIVIGGFVLLGIFLLVVGFFVFSLVAKRVNENGANNNENVDVTDNEGEEEVVLEKLDLPVDINALKDAAVEIEDSIADINAKLEVLDDLAEENDEPPTL